VQQLAPHSNFRFAFLIILSMIVISDFLGTSCHNLKPFARLSTAFNQRFNLNMKYYFSTPSFVFLSPPIFSGDP